MTSHHYSQSLPFNPFEPILSPLRLNFHSLMYFLNTTLPYSPCINTNFQWIFRFRLSIIFWSKQYSQGTGGGDRGRLWARLLYYSPCPHPFGPPYPARAWISERVFIKLHFLIHSSNIVGTCAAFVPCLAHTRRCCLLQSPDLQGLTYLLTQAQPLRLEPLLLFFVFYLSWSD